jgi:uncharacterized protein (TIGR04255 family)
VTGPQYVPELGLPAFTHPPVVEAVIGVEFSPLPGLGAVNIADLYRRWVDVYARYEERAALPPSFGPGGEPVESYAIDSATPLRLLMSDVSDNRLLSLQADRLFHNWRSTGPGAEYPRYVAMREEFARRWNEFLEFVAERHLGQIEPNYVEVSFVNRFQVDSAESDLGLAFLRESPKELPGEALVARSQLVRSVNIPQVGEGWMSLISGPGSEAPNDHVQLSVSTRVGARIESSLESILPALDRVHDLGVRGFAAATTPERHALWGRSM